MGTIETGEFQRRVQEVIRLPFRPLVPPLLDKQVPSLRKEIAGQLLLARHQHQQQNNNNNSQVKQVSPVDASLMSGPISCLIDLSTTLDFIYIGLKN